jgi:GntR family transcriptional regulator, transcriptional repressor for pyruvate dehydrogenase complex
MPSELTTRNQDVPAKTADAVLEGLLSEIVGGAYPGGARLPAERDLATTLGTSRSTLREALGRLTEWRVVEPRRGSGIAVRHIREWSIEVLPAYLRHARPSPDRPSIAQTVIDMLALRRSVLVQLIPLAVDRLEAADVARARAAAGRAWELRAEGAAFAAADFDISRAIVEGANLLPALWMLNRMQSVYVEIARSLAGATLAPSNYLDVHEKFFAALEKRDATGAVAIMSEYLLDHDRRLVLVAGDPQSHSKAHGEDGK